MGYGCVMGLKKMKSKKMWFSCSLIMLNYQPLPSQETIRNFFIRINHQSWAWLKPTTSLTSKFPVEFGHSGH